MDLQAVRATTEALAREAGEVLMTLYGQPHEETAKSNVYDIVTEGDKAVEAVVVPALRAAFPDHGIVSEEGGGAETLGGGAEYFWHIDPVDGTANFSKNLPLFAISIGLSDRDYQPLVGVVYNPVYQDMFSAARGHGATHNGRPLRVSTTAVLEQAVLASGFPTYAEGIEANLVQWRKFLLATRGMRRFGSAALDLCFVAAGWLDCFFETGIHSWDVMAGLLCVQEAGGMTTDYSGGTDRLFTGAEIIASNGHIHSEIMRLLKADG